MTTSPIYSDLCMGAFNSVLISSAIKSSLMAEVYKTVGLRSNNLISQMPTPHKMFVFGAISVGARSLIGRIIDIVDNETFHLQKSTSSDKKIYRFVRNCLAFWGSLKCAEFFSSRLGYSLQINRYVIMIQLADLFITHLTQN